MKEILKPLNLAFQDNPRLSQELSSNTIVMSQTK